MRRARSERFVGAALAGAALALLDPGATRAAAAPVPAAHARADTTRSTALANGTASAQVRRGEVVTVPVTLDLPDAGAQGDLGAVQFELSFPGEILRYVSAAPGVAGAAQTHLGAPGRVRFAFASTAPQGKPRLTLVTLSFRVAPDAPAGARGDIRLSYTARPVTTGFRPLALPVATGATVSVVR
ncbi:MAG TPA: cohesin domain-containing protein [Longimicrobium sp.]|jgi:hypothetical protein